MDKQNTYADRVNNQFHKHSSQYVTLAERIKESVNSNFKKILISDSIQEFVIRNKNLKKQWKSFRFCKSLSTTLDKIIIDITLQRMLDIIHAVRILDNFQPIRVMPIQVYKDPACPDKYVCWDGQHTAVVLYLIATQCLDLDPSKCEIPIVVYDSELKSEMRENFMALNGDAKKPLDYIDYFHQMVFGIRTDNSTNPSWQLVEEKQRALESFQMFATHEKFQDTEQPGALSRLEELMDTKNYDLSITQNFCKYFWYMCNSSRPVQPKECWMLYEYFKFCQISKITVDDNYIKGVVKSLQTAFNGDFDSIKLASKARASYQDYWRNSHDQTLFGITYPEKRLALTFLVAQIAKNFSGPVPVINPLWPVDNDDLF